MAYCPECRTEYPPAIVLCRSCGGALSDEPPADEGGELIALVPLCPVAGVVEASMLQGALESQGLHPRVMGHSLPAHGTILRDWSTRSWGEIRVPEDELEEARLVLADFTEAVRRLPGAGAGAEDEVGEEADWAEEDEDDSDDGPPPELYPLCAVGNLAEGVMLKGALAGQGLHPVLAGPAGGHAAWAALEGAPGEIRVPREELLEARAVLADFRRALERAGESRAAGDDPSTPA